MALRWTSLAPALIAVALFLACATAAPGADPHTLTVAKENLRGRTATITSNPAGIVCGSTCTNTFTDPTVTLTTTLPAGFTVSWQGQTCQGAGETQTSTTCTVVPNDGTVTAHYIDATAPTITLTSPSATGPYSGTLHLKASASDNQSDIAKVDFSAGATVIATDTTGVSGVFEADFDTTTVPDGQVSIGAVAFNGDNQAQTANPRAVTIDNTAPGLAITSGPDGQSFGPGSTQTFEFTAADASSVATVCSMDSTEQYSACAGSASYTDLGEGTHTFRVKAVDAAGNQSELPRGFTIDRTGPTTSITAGPEEFSSSALGSALFNFAASEPAAFQCRLYTAGVKAPDFGACSGPDSHGASNLAPGDWIFEVFATDSFGNAGPTAARHFAVVFASGFDAINAKLAAAFRVRGRATTVTKLQATRVPTGTRVAITCRGRTCPFKSRQVAERRQKVALERLFKNRRLQPGTVIELRITAAGLTGQVVRYKTRRSKQPARSNLCLAPGASTPTRCR